MRTRAVTWIAAFALAGVCVGQQTEEEKRFYADYARSEQQAVAAFPDVGNAATPLARKVAEMDKALAADEDPLYNSADKPLILTRRAAKELGIKPVEAKPIAVPEPQAPVELDGKVIPELNGFKSVTIRRVEPDGLRIIHESGTAKIPIEKLTDVQRVKYGLSAEGASQYRKQAAENAATSYARQQEAARNQAEAPRATAAAPTEEKASLEPWIGPGHQMAMDSYLAKFGPRFQHSGTFKEGPMKGKTLDQAIAQFEQTWATSPASVRMNWARRAKMAGQTPETQDAAVDARAAEEEARRQRADDTPAVVTPSPRQISYLEGGKYQKRGNVIASGGNFGSGYTISGDSLTKGGSVTHKRSGSMWMPVKTGESQIYDP